MSEHVEKVADLVVQLRARVERDRDEHGEYGDEYERRLAAVALEAVEGYLDYAGRGRSRADAKTSMENVARLAAEAAS